MASGKRRKGKGKAGGRQNSSQSARPGAGGTSPQGRDIEALLEQARSSVDPLVAVGLYQEALQSKPDDTRIMGDAAELMLQLGETAAAQELLTRSIAVAPDGEPDKYLYMAQLCGGHEALGFYEKGLDMLLQIEPSAAESKESALGLKRKVCMAYCSVGELFLTDLCFEENAEQRCQDALDKSMSFDYGGPEPLHALANLRLSQSRHEEAVQSAEEAFRRLETCEPPPEHEFRVSLAKILIECSDAKNTCCEKALEVLCGLMEEDDENVEAWFLMGFAFNRLQPPDPQSARTYLMRASDMLEKVKEAQQEAGVEFAFQDQVQLVQEQLQVAENMIEAGDLPIDTEEAEALEPADISD